MPAAAPAGTTGGGDLAFSSDYAVTSTTDGGGPLLTDVEVILCFWGSYWSTMPPPSPSSNDYRTAIAGIVGGPFMNGAKQYRNVGQGSVIYSEINAASDPVNGYTNADVVNMLKSRIQTAGMPAPAAGRSRLYAVIVPPGIHNSLTQYNGQHQSFTYNGSTAAYAWISNNGALTGSDCVTKIFSHEVIDSCTNPNVDTLNNGILVNGVGVTGDEIADACNNKTAIIIANGMTCTVQAYWSKADNACVVPLAQGDNYEGLWWAAPAGSESGWGINLAHQGNAIFATWFTYDVNGKAWWLTMTANQTGQTIYSGQLVRTNGAPFFAFAPPALASVVGNGTLSFTSATAGTFSYQVDVGGNVVAQTKAIALQAFGPVPVCVWGAQPNLALATNYQDLWWASPAGSESGWGVNLTHQGTTIFATWFTYDANHNPLWLSATAAQTGVRTYSGTMFLTTGPAFGSTPFNPALVGRTAVGTATFTFSDGNNGVFAYNVDLGDGVNKATQSKAITRQVFRAPGTVCQ